MSAKDMTGSITKTKKPPDQIKGRQGKAGVAARLVCLR
jgi:hypothetical protein